jgi:hypothetical protein
MRIISAAPKNNTMGSDVGRKTIYLCPAPGTKFKEIRYFQK